MRLCIYVEEAIGASKHGHLEAPRCHPRQRPQQSSVSFYRKLFGIEPSKIRQGYAKFDVKNPPLNFTLNEASSVERGALSHLGIQVSSTEDVLAFRERWIAVGPACAR